jgi:hypothetical protein
MKFIIQWIMALVIATSLARSLMVAKAGTG